MKSHPKTKRQPRKRLRAATGSAAWSKTPPGQPGHYWVSFGRGERHTMTVLEVENWHGRLQCYYHQGWRPLDDAAYWVGVQWWSEAIMPPNSVLADTTQEAKNANEME